jgi:glycopeptide antibiotics resistance protein
MQVVINDLGIPVWPLGLLTLLAVLVILRHRRHSLPYLFFFIIFWLYIMAAVDKTFFPLQINGLYVDVMRKAPLFSQVNLVPFSFSTHGLSVAGYLVLTYNILLSIPLGFGVNFLRRTGMKELLWLAFTVGFGIEAMQFVMTLLLRYPYRVADINDVWLNALGVFVGYGSFQVFAWLYREIDFRLSIKRGRLLAYLSAVADRCSGEKIW